MLSMSVIRAAQVAAEVAAGLDAETPSDEVAAPTEGAVEEAHGNDEVATAAGPAR